MNGNERQIFGVCSHLLCDVAVRFSQNHKNIDIIDGVRGRAVIPVYLGYWAVSSRRR